ncbi:MAG: cation diffusion facilitator family transporter [Anaerolineales bacterium]|nr:cation diffusion facilitator family transporter [Anaerolineales bacterium]
MHEHYYPASTEDTRSIKIAFFLNLGFAIFEIFGGIWTNSLAILSDALHDFGDSVFLGLSWYLEGRSNQGRDVRYSYGYRRFSLLSALANTLVLSLGSLYILSEAIPRLFNPQHSNASGMMLFAVVGILVNGVAVLRLRKGKTMNMRMVAWHMLEDVLGWAAVLVVSVTLLFWDIHLLDPILSVLITLYVLYNVVNNLRKTLGLFLQAVPDDVDIVKIEQTILGLPLVSSVHHTHAWSLDGERHVLTMHIVVDERAEKEDLIHIRSQFQQMARDIRLEHTTVEIEYQNEDCAMK